MRLVATAAAGPRRGPGRGGRRSGECDLGGDPRMRTGRRDAKSAFVRHGWAFLWLVDSASSVGPTSSGRSPSPNTSTGSDMQVMPARRYRGPPAEFEAAHWAEQ